MDYTEEVNEAVINGILHFRAGPRCKWIQAYPKTLTEMLLKERKAAHVLEVELSPVLKPVISMVK